MNINPFRYHVGIFRLGTCQKLAGGAGEGETEGGSQLFETAEKGGVMKNGPLKGEGSCKYMCVFMKRFTHRRKGSSLFCKKKPGRNRRVE